MQPNAGPWLSPKLVTVNSLPMVLPDMMEKMSSEQRMDSAGNAARWHCQVLGG
jgi:hypothetical protein